MKQTTGKIGPRRIEYDEIINEGTYFTGIAHLENPAGPGVFEIRVSGQEPEIKRYSEEAVVQELALEILDPDDIENILREQHGSVLKSRREHWRSWLKARCEALGAMIDKADLASLADLDSLGERLGQEITAFDQRMPPRSFDLDLARDRMIGISHKGIDPERGQAGRLWYVIDPVVPQGTYDLYVPSVPGISEAFASITSQAGANADLYLFRGGQLLDWSTLNVPTESVSGSGGIGAWELYVYGVMTTEYTHPAQWIWISNIS